MLVKQVKRIAVVLTISTFSNNYWRFDYMDEVILQNKNGKILASSRDVAEKFGKRNSDVNRSIENLTVQNCTVKNMFEKSTYISSRGRE